MSAIKVHVLRNPKIQPSVVASLCRDDLRIHKFPEPVVLLEDIQIDSNDIETIRVAYPDRNYDSEGMVVDPDTLDIILFTKHSTSDVFRVPPGSDGEVRVVLLFGLRLIEEIFEKMRGILI